LDGPPIGRLPPELRHGRFDAFGAARPLAFAKMERRKRGEVLMVPSQANTTSATSRSGRRPQSAGLPSGCGGAGSLPERTVALALAGALILVTVAVGRLPAPRDLIRRPVTPFDRARDPGAGPILSLLTQASTVIPARARVAVRAVSGSLAESSFCSLLARSLLPSINVVPAEHPLDGPARPDFVILVGLDVPEQGPGRLVLRTSVGAVWRLEP
jgi:hypothetical protein